jgi:hypothetical protein
MGVNGAKCQPILVLFTWFVRTLRPPISDAVAKQNQANFYLKGCVRCSEATSHVERWNNTVQQRLARLVRKTLSFSKCDVMHHVMLEWFIIEYNLEVASLTP